MDEKKPMSRREMLRSKLGLGLAQSIGYAMGQAHGVTKHIERSFREPPPPLPPKPNLLAFHRPPGSIDEIAFAAQCTKCNACIEACPPQTLTPLTGIFGKAFETPIIDPNLGGCTMCQDRPCAKACAIDGEDIISALLPVKMGHATVRRSSCRSLIGEACTLCIDVCPIENAIDQDWRKIPMINEDICTGCGLCVNACPVEPAAISIVPLQSRCAHPSHDQNANGPSPDSPGASSINPSDIADEGTSPEPLD